MIVKNNRRTIATLTTACAIISLASGAFALEGHIEGSSCFSTAGPGEIQGAEGSGLCSDADVSCDYVAGTCTLPITASRGGKNAHVIGAVKVPKLIFGKPPEKAEGAVTFVAPATVAIEEPD